MKNQLLSILICGVMCVGLTGCQKDKIGKIGLEDANIKIQQYFGNEKNDRTNLVYNYIDSDNNVIIVGLVDSSKEKQEEFLSSIFDKNTIKYIKINSLIEFKEELPVITSNSNFKIKRYNISNDVKYTEYYKNQERTIYFARNIEEFYILDKDDNGITLKNYITKTNQTFDDSIKTITDKLDMILIAKDGGTTIYKLEQLDLTMIVCNTLEGNKNIYIDRYNKQFDETMCK